MNYNLEEIKQFIKDNINDADCGLFFTRNWCGDEMENVYYKDGVQIDICYGNFYYEVFGLSKEDQKELKNYYNSLIAH